MDLTEALEEYEKYYADRKREFSIIFSMCNFSGKKVLEIGSGRWGHFAEKVKGIADFTASDKSQKEMDILKTKFDVNTRVFDATEIPSEDKSFDIVFSRWVLDHSIDVAKAVEEMCRVSKDIVFNVLPSGDGDETKAKSIKYPKKKEERESRIRTIKEILEKNGFRTEERRETIGFIFPGMDKLIETINALCNNELSGSELQKLRDFLSSRKRQDSVHFTQGVCFLLAKR